MVQQQSLIFCLSFFFFQRGPTKCKHGNASNDPKLTVQKGYGEDFVKFVLKTGPKRATCYKMAMTAMTQNQQKAFKYNF